MHVPWLRVDILSQPIRRDAQPQAMFIWSAVAITHIRLPLYRVQQLRVRQSCPPPPQRGVVVFFYLTTRRSVAVTCQASGLHIRTQSGRPAGNLEALILPHQPNFERWSKTNGGSANIRRPNVNTSRQRRNDIFLPFRS